MVKLCGWKYLQNANKRVSWFGVDAFHRILNEHSRVTRVNGEQADSYFNEFAQLLIEWASSKCIFDILVNHDTSGISKLNLRNFIARWCFTLSFGPSTDEIGCQVWFKYSALALGRANNLSLSKFLYPSLPAFSSTEKYFFG